MGYPSGNPRVFFGQVKSVAKKGYGKYKEYKEAEPERLDRKLSILKKKAAISKQKREISKLRSQSSSPYFMGFDMSSAKPTTTTPKVTKRKTKRRKKKKR